jgi:hypothetical protein
MWVVILKREDFDLSGGYLIAHCKSIVCRMNSTTCVTRSQRVRIFAKIRNYNIATTNSCVDADLADLEMNSAAI